MDNLTINFANPGGIDADAVVMADSANTFGVRRADTGAVVVVAGTAMVHVGVGQYSLTFVQPASNLTYLYSVKSTTTGVDTYFSAIAVSVLGMPVCPYFTYNQFIRRWGLTNVKVASNKDGKTNANAATVPDFAALQDSFDYSIDEINNTLRGGQYSVPLDFTPNGGMVPPFIVRGAMLLAYADLYDVRGMDEKNIKDNRLAKQVRVFYDDLATYKSGVKQMLALLQTDSSFSPVQLGMSAIRSRNLGYWHWVPDAAPFFVGCSGGHENTFYGDGVWF